MAEAPREPSEAELREALEAELKRLKVSDVLIQTLYTVSSLGYRKLGAEDRDLEQARLAVDALRALTPVLQGITPDEVIRDFNQVTANLQLAYAKAVSDSAESAPAEEEKPRDDG